MKKTILAATIAAFMPTMMIASEVDSTAVTTFQSQTPAVASEVNANFSALITAINDNATRLAALEAAATAISVSGNGYKLFAVNPDLAVADDSSFVNIAAGLTQAVLSFGTGGSGTLNITDDAFYEVNFPSNQLFNFSGEEVGIENFTYTQDGSTVTITFVDNSTMQFTAAADGSLLVGVDNRYDLNATFGPNDDLPGELGSVALMIAVRQ